MSCKLLRNLVSRGTAMAFGIAFGAASVRTALRAWHLGTNVDGVPASNETGFGYLVAFAAILSLPAILLLGFALLPTRALYAIDPTPTSIDADDGNGLLGSIGRGL